MSLELNYAVGLPRFWRGIGLCLRHAAFIPAISQESKERGSQPIEEARPLFPVRL
jgi:hypothetical protein